MQHSRLVCLYCLESIRIFLFSPFNEILIEKTSGNEKLQILIIKIQDFPYFIISSVYFPPLSEERRCGDLPT